MTNYIKNFECMDLIPSNIALSGTETMLFNCMSRESVLKRTLADPRYHQWYPILYIMANTGLRVGELTGLRWCDVNFIKEEISINHNLIYYNHRDDRGCYFSITKPKTDAGIRTVPMTKSVVKAFRMYKQYLDDAGIKCLDHIDGYDDFIFVGRFGHVHNQATINSAIHRIVKNINLDILDKEDVDSEPLLIPDFTCHILRHTFATRLCERGVNIKVIQALMGHEDFQTTMNIYVNVTKTSALGVDIMNLLDGFRETDIEVTKRGK